MYNKNLVRYALLNHLNDSTIQKIHKIIEYSLKVIQDGVLLYNYKDKEIACQHLFNLIVAKSINDVTTLDNKDRELVKLVLENKALFNKNDNLLNDIKEKAKLFDKTVFEFETIEDYKAALEEFVMNDGSEIHHNTDMDNDTSSAMLDDESDELPNLDEISDMLDDAINECSDMEHREMLNGEELPTKGRYAIVERTLGIGATDWDLWKQNGNTYHDLGIAFDLKPCNYARGWYSKEYEVVNLADPTWKQNLIENDDNEYFIMKRELTRGGTDATDWVIDSDIFETWGEANLKIQKNYDDFQFIIASRPKNKEEKKVETRRKRFKFGN